MRMLPLLLCACTPDPGDCTTGFTRHDDGNCYSSATDTDGETTTPEDTGGADTEPPVTFLDLLAAMPPCEPGSTDGLLDLEDGCADGACVNMDYDAMVAAIGEAPTCDSIYIRLGDSYESSQLSCDWSNGLGMSFADDDQDGLPDTGARGWPLYVDLPWEGGTTEGLGLGASMSCFVDLLGPPDSASIDAGPEEGYLITYLYYGSIGLSVHDDFYNKDGSYGSDGLVDGLSIYGF